MQEQTDLGEEPVAHEYRNKGVTSERAASPSPSSVSLRTDWSMDPPANFKDFPLDTRVNSERAASPVPSYMSLKTDWSMDPPANFKDFSSDTRFEEEKMINSHQMDSTFMLKLLTDHHLKCPVCKSLLKDPVSTSCGHNCCRDCINAFWDNCSGVFVCPQCGEASETRPVLNTNTALAEVVKNLQQAGFSPALPAQAYAGPQDVACDFCTETVQRLKAVKACSTCDVFLCETHVRQHYTIPALQKHTLSDVTGDMKMRPSQQIQSTEVSSSGRQDQTDTTHGIIKEEIKSIPESVLNTSTVETEVPEEAAKIATPETQVNKEDTDVRNTTKLEQEMSRLQISVSKKQKQYYDDDDDDREEDDYEEKDDDDVDDDDYREEDDYQEKEVDVDDDVNYGEDFGADNYEEEAAGGHWDDGGHINYWDDDVKEDIYDVEDYTHDYDNYDDFRDSYDHCDDDY